MAPRSTGGGLLHDEGDSEDGGAPAAVGPAPPLLPLAAAPPVSKEEAARRLEAELVEFSFCSGGGGGQSLADQNAVCRMLRYVAEHNLLPEHILPSATAVKKVALSVIASSPDLAWHPRTVTAPSFPDIEVNFYSRNLADVLKYSISTTQLQWDCSSIVCNGAGERIYNNPSGAEYMRVAHKYVTEELAGELPGAGIAWLQLFSDKNHVTHHKGVSLYPCGAVLANTDRATWAKQYARSCFLLLPVLTKKMFTMNDDHFKLFKSEILSEALRGVLGDILDWKKGAFYATDIDGKARLVVPVLHSYLTDLEERHALMGLIGQTMCSYCTADKKTALDGGCPLRTSEWYRTTLAKFGPLRPFQPSSSRFRAVREATRLQGCEPAGLWLFEIGLASKLVEEGLIRMVPGSLFPHDPLHFLWEGMAKHTVRSCITGNLDRLYGTASGAASARSTRLTDALVLRCRLLLDHGPALTRAWPDLNGFFRASRGSQGEQGCSLVGANEMKNMMQILPLVVHGIHPDTDSGKDWRTKVLVFFLDYSMELLRYNRPPGHTDTSLGKVAAAAARLKNVVLTHFKEDQTSEWHFPKAHELFVGHFNELVPLLGRVDRFDTNFGENSHKAVKGAYGMTNKQSKTMAAQTASRLSLSHAASRNLADVGGTAKPPGLGRNRTAMRIAKERQKSSLPATADGTLLLAKCGEKKYMPGYEGLEFFPAALDDWLVSEGGAKGSVGRVAIFSHAVLHSALAHHPDEVNVAIFEKVMATPSSYGKRRFSFVAIDAPGEEWIGQLRLIFQLPDGTAMVFVRYVVEDLVRAGKGQLFSVNGCSPLKWEQRAQHTGAGGKKSKASYGVVPLELLIRMEFVFPDVTGVHLDADEGAGENWRRWKPTAWIRWPLMWGADDRDALDEALQG